MISPMLYTMAPNSDIQVQVPDSELPMFPRHVKPALYFTCEYCDYKHPEFTVSHDILLSTPLTYQPSLAPVSSYEPSNDGD